MSFSTNVDPKRFGAGKDIYKKWICICGTENRAYIKKCLMCGVEKELAERAKAS
jgi:hypothetical protein